MSAGHLGLPGRLTAAGIAWIAAACAEPSPNRECHPDAVTASFVGTVVVGSDSTAIAATATQTVQTLPRETFMRLIDVLGLGAATGPAESITWAVDIPFEPGVLGFQLAGERGPGTRLTVIGAEPTPVPWGTAGPLSAVARSGMVIHLLAGTFRPIAAHGEFAVTSARPLAGHLRVELSDRDRSGSVDGHIAIRLLAESGTCDPA